MAPASEACPSRLRGRSAEAVSNLQQGESAPAGHCAFIVYTTNIVKGGKARDMHPAKAVAAMGHIMSMQDRPPREFSGNRYSPDGLHGMCKLCTSKYSQKRYKSRISKGLSMQSATLWMYGSYHQEKHDVARQRAGMSPLHDLSCPAITVVNDGAAVPMQAPGARQRRQRCSSPVAASSSARLLRLPNALSRQHMAQKASLVQHASCLTHDERLQLQAAVRSCSVPCSEAYVRQWRQRQQQWRHCAGTLLLCGASQIALRSNRAAEIAHVPSVAGSAAPPAAALQCPGGTNAMAPAASR